MRLAYAIAAAAALSAPPIRAQTETAQLCTIMGDTAEAIMRHRQSGAAMSVLMNALAGADTVDEGSRDAGRRMVIMAYEQPRYSTDRNQRRAIADFRNDVEVACFRAVGE